MTFEQNGVLPKRFVTSVLPWLIGLGSLLVYLLTLSHGATVSSIGIVARESGWLWQPELSQPLAFLLYSPFRLFPEPMIPVALNVFNAVLAALAVTLLARAVALLPHDRTSDQREVVQDDHSVFSAKSAWIPPVLAAVVLGLQISFWENATAVSSEIIDVLVFAYVVRCLLESRIDPSPSWIFRAAFVYAAGMTNNWALIGLAPFFLAAIIWIRGIAFFNGRFIVGLALWGLAGLCFYLLLPVVQSLSPSASAGFGEVLRVNLVGQKQLLSWTFSYLKDNYRFVAVGATSLLPLFFIGLRWRSSFGDTSPIGIFITKMVFHIVHAVFFVVCLLVVLSPPYSPRQQFASFPFLGAFLNHTFLAALVAGYCSGYFLVVCSPAFRSRSRARMNALLRFAGYLGWGAVLLISIVVPAALLVRNLEPIQLTNNVLLDRFMSLSLAAPSQNPGVIVSDEPTKLALFRAYLVRRGEAEKFLFYDTKSSEWSDYHVVQLRTQGERWPATFATLTNRAKLSPQGMQAFFVELAALGPTYYLEPSFGYFFERFNLTPNGMVFEVAPYPTNQLLQAPLPQAVVEKNQQWWEEFDQQLLPLLERWIPSEDAPRRRPAWQAAIYKKLHLSDERIPTAQLLGQYCSRAATHWAVELQRSDRWPEAAAALRRALILSPDNVVAQINLEYNEARQQGRTAPTSLAANIEEEFGRYQNWNQVLGICGPFDEPRFTFEQGRTFFSGGLYRQAVQSIHRVVQLDPDNYTANVWLAELYAMLGQPAESLKVVNGLRAKPALYAEDAVKTLNLDRLEATALFVSGDAAAGRSILLQALGKKEVDVGFRATAAQLFLQAGMHQDALPLLEEVVAQYPSDVRSLANLGYACLQLEQYDRARQVLTSALELDPKNSVVRLNRAITFLRAKQYDAAKEDYTALEAEFPNAYQVQFGLGEIAAAVNDTNGAIARFEACLKLTPPGTPDYIQVSNRLAAVRTKGD